MTYIGDDRIAPQYPSATASRSALIMTSCQMSSLNEWEQTKLLPAWKKHVGLQKMPSADTIGAIATKMRCDDIRTVIKNVYAKLKRNKALKSGFHENLFFLVIDGHECCNSYLRSCDDCLQREITTSKGIKIQYYHRYALGMLISMDGICIPLDVEMQQPGEDEVASSVRLVERLCTMYPRAFDVVLADGLYARAPFFKTVTGFGKEVIAVLKDDRRDLIKEVRNRCKNMAPQQSTRSDGVTAVQSWDLEGCNDWTQLGVPVRVLRTLETSSVRRQATKITKKFTSEWLWVTTISIKQLQTKQFIEVAHHRWDIENKGFNELATYWHLNHIYKHDSNAIVVFTLFTMLSYLLFHAFLHLNIKKIVRSRYTKKHINLKIKAQFYSDQIPEQ